VKILYISQYFPPEIAAPAARVSELSRHWARDGHDVAVLTGFPNHPTGIVPPAYRAKLRRLVIRELMDGVCVVRTWLWPRPNRGAVGRMLSFVSFAVSAAISGLFLARPDIVIATSPQLLVGLSGWWLARAKRVPFVLEVRDLWPESLAAVGMGREGSTLHRMLALLAGFLYRESDHIVVVTPAFKEELIERWKVPAAKISIVQNGVESDLFRPSPPSADLRRELNAEGKFMVCYIGTMGMAHGLDTILQAAAQLRESAFHVLFVLVGEGAEKQRIADQAKFLGLSNVCILDQQPRERIPAYICTSDACLVLLRNTPLFKTVIPTKMLEFMSCGRPIILGVDGQARKIMEEANAGIFVVPENASALAQAILHLAGDEKLRTSLGNNGRRHILAHFSRQRTAEEYLELLSGLVRGESPRY